MYEFTIGNMNNSQFTLMCENYKYKIRMSIIYIAILSIPLFSQEVIQNGDLIVNIRADHNSIRSIFVVANSMFITNRGTMDYSDDIRRIWERNLLKSGYDVITRDEMEHIIQEQSLTLSGLIEEDQAIKIGKIVGADAVLFIEDSGILYVISDSLFQSPKDIKTKLLSISTGQILFISDYYCWDSLDFNEEKKLWDWVNNLFVQYKIKVSGIQKGE